MDCNNQLSIFNNPYHIDEVLENVVKDLGVDDVNSLALVSKELHKKVNKMKQKLIIDPTSFDQHLPSHLFEYLVKKIFIC